QMGDDLRRLESRFAKCNYPGRFLFKPKFNINDQRKLLAASDIQIQDSDRYTGASEYTEADVSANAGLQMGPPFWEGIIQHQGIAVNRRVKQGNTLIPLTTDPQDYLRVVLWANEAFKTGELSLYQAQSLRLSRVLEASITAAEYLRFWNSAFQGRALNLVKPRICGEVSIEQVNMFYYGQQGQHAIERTGNQFLLKGNEGLDSMRKELEVVATINLVGFDAVNFGVSGVIPFDMVKAVMVNDFGAVIPLAFKRRHDNKLDLYARVPLDFPLPFNGAIEVNSGIWKVDYQFKASIAHMCYPARMKITDAQRQRVINEPELVDNLKEYFKKGFSDLNISSHNVQIDFKDRRDMSLAECVSPHLVLVDSGLAARAPPKGETLESYVFQVRINDIIRHDVLGHAIYMLDEKGASSLSLQHFLCSHTESSIILDFESAKKDFGIIYEDSYRKYLTDIKSNENEIAFLGDSLRRLNSKEDSLDDFCVRIHGKFILNHPDRVVIETANKKYVIKIYNLSRGKGLYLAEKDFYLNRNPVAHPELLYFDDQAQALVMENLNNLGLVQMFAFMHEPGCDLERINNSVVSLGQALGIMHHKWGLKGKVSQKEYADYAKRAETALSTLNQFGYNTLPGDSLISFVERMRSFAEGEEYVYGHGDPFAWNIFLSPDSGKVEGLIDAELSGPCARSLEIANTILGLIDARKNNAQLILSTPEILKGFIDYYSSMAQINVGGEIFWKRMHFYLICQLIIGALVAHEKWGKWVEPRLDLARELIKINNLSLESFTLAVCTVNQGNSIQWSGNFDLLGAGYSGPASGVEVRLGLGGGVDFFAQVYIPGKIRDGVISGQICAALKTDINDERIYLHTPFEFLEFAGNNFLFKGYLKAMRPGNYTVEPVFSLDSGETWMNADLPYGPCKLMVSQKKALTVEGIEAVILGDPHGDLSGFRRALIDLKVIRESRDFMRDEWLADNITVVVVGDFLDRGNQQIELYQYLKYLRIKAQENNSRFYILIGNHELLHLQGLADDNRAGAIIPSIREDVLHGDILASVVVKDRIVVHGGITPMVVSSLMRQLRWKLLEFCAQHLGKDVSGLTDEEISAVLVSDQRRLPLEHIAAEFNSRLVKGVENNDFSDVIFSRGNAHFGPKSYGETDYMPGGLMWACFDGELSRINEIYLLPMVVGHKEGYDIRYSPGARVVNVNLFPKHGFGRNAGVLVHDGRRWEAVYFDGRSSIAIPELNKSISGFPLSTYPLPLTEAAQRESQKQFGRDWSSQAIEVKGFKVENQLPKELNKDQAEVISKRLAELEHILGRAPPNLANWTLIFSNDPSLTQGSIAACNIATRTVYLNPYFFAVSAEDLLRENLALEQLQLKILYHELISHISRGITDEREAVEDTAQLLKDLFHNCYYRIEDVGSSRRANHADKVKTISFFQQASEESIPLLLSMLQQEEK
ncbi:MAG: metallophosphoesterase, partial [Candidatus Omnitrophica bacterium]|nr:metallophosphoesterase [Candidatus Omnitrophota bacterium]